MKAPYKPPIAWMWALSLIAAWVLVASQLEQPLWQLQRSPALVAFGAFKGENLTAAGAWRLFVSQWLHVKFPHMLFNALMIGLLGQALQNRTSTWAMLLVGLGGGAVGQYFSAVAYPSLFVSGASQAYLSLCGAILLLFRSSQATWWLAVFGTVVAAGLDVFVSGHGTIKVGHAAAFITGILGGAGLLTWKRLRNRRR
jgi:membrane associated rhomboid family serine protease